MPGDAPLSHMPPSTLSGPVHRQVRRWKDEQWETIEEVASREERVHITHPGGQCHLWACPQDLIPLALGHVILDQLHDGEADAPSPHGLRRGSAKLLPTVEQNGCTEHALQVILAPRATARPFRAECTLNENRTTAAHLCRCMEKALAIPGLWDGTGCFHRAALVHVPSGEIRHWTEDIGRHNCLDRLAGLCSLHNLAPEEHALFISARITASLYRKARRAGFSFIVSRAAVTSESLTHALAHGVTLVGYCRSAEGRLTVFADAHERILHDES